MLHFSLIIRMNNDSSLQSNLLIFWYTVLLWYDYSQKLYHLSLIKMPKIPSLVLVN